MKNRTNTQSFMESRHEPHDSLDFFPTQPWVTRVVCEVLPVKGGQRVWDPAAGEGHMTDTIYEYTERVIATDVHDYGVGHWTHDFLMMGKIPSIAKEPVDWIITNPPYKLAEQFVVRALDLQPKKGVAMLLRSQWRHNPGRYERLFSKRPPTHVYEISDRLTMLRGKCQERTDTGAKSGATEYSWFVWELPREPLRDWSPSYIGYWIPPGTRKRLEKPEDYDDV